MYGIDLGASCARIAWLDERRQPVTADGAVPAVAVAGQTAAGDEDGDVVSVRSRLFAAESAVTAVPSSDAVRTSPSALVGGVFTELLERAGRAGAEQERRVVLNLPPGGSDPHEMALRRAAEAIGLRVDKVVPDPVAVALHYGALRDGTDSTVLVWDQGGSGLRLTVLAVSSDRRVRLVETAEHPLGGSARDEAVARELLRQVPYGRVAPPLLRGAERLRLRLAQAAEATETVRLDGTDHTVAFDRERLDAVLAPERARARDALVQVLEAAQERTGQWPSGLLLAGGVAATPGTAEALADDLGLPVRSATPELAVVRGLAMIQDFGLLRIESGRSPRPSSGAGPGVRERGRPAEPMARPAPRPGPVPADDPEPVPADDPEPVPADDPEPVPADDPEPRGSQPPPATARFPDALEPGTPTRDGPAHHTTRPAAGPASGPSADPHSDPREGPAGPSSPAADVWASSPPGPGPHAGAREERRTPSPGGDLVGVPVSGLQAVRRDDHLLLLWEWPPDSLTARVRWRLEDPDTAGGRVREGDVRCSRRVYEHDGGLDLVVGRGGVTLTVEAMVPGEADAWEPPSSLTVSSGLPVVRYEPVVRRRLHRKVARVSFTSETSCLLPALHVVLGRGRYRPAHPADGTVVHEIPPQRVEAHTPLVIEFPYPSSRSDRGDAWLVCFPAEPAHEDIDLRPAALHRLKVT
ncbi:Hsp70 family protein [Streptomyces sp. NRRL B-3229]|uniref:Hsp70 family protein n=1 Tax=Streptomyces sp. NRRL B-3229 TaxID=1463836 RepID=UPI0004C1F569|nr:Hsp70 family protein [Streptomyces sp. NRRL B-3229]